MKTEQATARFASHTDALSYLVSYVGRAQLRALALNCRGEEGQYFRSMLVELANKIDNMPETFEQDGLNEKSVVHLHYFTGGADWFITEKDAAGLDGDVDGQVQVFGLADLFQDGGELGYVSLPELFAAGAELDLHWTPMTLEECQTKSVAKMGGAS